VHLAEKFASANMNQKKIFHIFSIWVSKSTEFDADLESVGKVAKKFINYMNSLYFPILVEDQQGVKIVSP
jgi:hypothetical protein